MLLFQGTPKDTWSNDFEIATNHIDVRSKPKIAVEQPVFKEPVSPSKSWNEMLLDLIQSFLKFAHQQKKAKVVR